MKHKKYPLLYSLSTFKWREFRTRPLHTLRCFLRYGWQRLMYGYADCDRWCGDEALLKTLYNILDYRAATYMNGVTHEEWLSIRAKAKKDVAYLIDHLYIGFADNETFKATHDRLIQFLNDYLYDLWD